MEKEEECISNLISKHVDGILLVSAATEQQPIHSRLIKYGIPCVLFDRKLKYMDYGAGIFVDNEFAVFKATEFLLRHGNRRLLLSAGAGNCPSRRRGLKATAAHWKRTACRLTRISGIRNLPNGNRVSGCAGADEKGAGFYGGALRQRFNCHRRNESVKRAE